VHATWPGVAELVSLGGVGLAPDPSLRHYVVG
jgi:hypothetical protein